MGGRDPLQLRVEQLLLRARATQTNVQNAKRVLAFREYLRKNALGESAATLERYMAALHFSGRNNEAIRVLGSVRAELTRRGVLDYTRSPRLDQLKRGIERAAAEQRGERKWRDPFPVSALRTLLTRGPRPGQNELLWRRDMALIALGLRAMRRPGELGQLRMRHVVWKPGGSLEIIVPHSKTDPLWSGQRIPIDAVPGSPTCPVRLLREYFRLRGPGARPEDPLFASATGAPLSTSAVNSIVKKAAEWSGVEGWVTGHSLRIGGATAALAAGLTLEQIKAIGHWESEAVMRYFRAVSAASAKASMKMGF